MTDFGPITDENTTIEAIELWQSHLFVAENPYHDLLKAGLTTLIYENAGDAQSTIMSAVATTAKQHLIESDLQFLSGEDSHLQTLNLYLTELINSIASDVNAAFWPSEAEADSEIIESWYHITRDGGYHDAHSHPNCSWCGIYYLEPGEASFGARNGLNRFYDPRVNADHYLDAGSSYLNGTGIWDIEPVAGQVVIFPSYLKHSALPYFGSRDRIVIAFNARVDLAETID